MDDSERGRIHGGVAHNVIVGKAEVEWEMRPVQSGDAEFIKDAMAEYVRKELLPPMQAVHPKASVHLDIVAEVIGMEVMDDNAARDLVGELTCANATGVVAFGTEAGLFQELGTHVFVCGPGSITQAHKPDEYLSIKEMDNCCSMLKRLGDKLTA